LEIGGTRRIESSSVRRTGRVSSADSKSFAAEEIHEAKTAAALTGAGPIAAVDTILALQGIEDSADERQRSVNHGDELLRLLDEVRDGLLAGGIPKQTLTRLAVVTAKRRDSFADPKLQTVLEEIELRARVELAKLEHAERLSL